MLLVMVFSRTEVSQFMKIPVLVQHYFEHLKTDGDMSFAGFIALHYQHNAQHEDPHHHNLPFKSHQCHHVNQADILDFQFPAICSQVSQEQKTMPLYKEEFYLSELLSSIWQPPQA